MSLYSCSPLHIPTYSVLRSKQEGGGPFVREGYSLTVVNTTRLNIHSSPELMNHVFISP